MERDWLQRLLLWLAMILPPWNIIWWIVGAIHYSIRGRYGLGEWGERGFLPFVLFAPVLYPVLIYGSLSDRLNGIRYDTPPKLDRSKMINDPKNVSGRGQGDK